MVALHLRQPLLVFELDCGERESDIGEFVVARARPVRDLLKARGRDCDTDAGEAPTQSARLPLGQRAMAM